MTEAFVPAATAHNDDAINGGATVNDEDSWRLQLPTSAARMVKERARKWFPPAIPSPDPQLEAAALQYRRRKPVVAATVPAKRPKSMTAGALIVAETASDDEAVRPTAGAVATPPETAATSGILVNRSSSSTSVPTPTWHAPWELSTVISSHLGWVRCLALDPANERLASGSADRTIKIWNFAAASVGAENSLLLTLTGHISPVRGLVFSDRHPYLFSVAEDKMVKCWDLETNQVVRHYHGHLSGIYCCAMHPVLDLLLTAGRDAVVRVWDIRTKQSVHVLSGHAHTISSVLTSKVHPAVTSGSHDGTIKLWDLVAGKCVTTLTHHTKAIRALCQPSFERTFLSGAADCLKKWQARDGRFLRSLHGHDDTVINTVAVNDDGVLVSGGDDGSLKFWDYRTGYQFQSTQSKVQPGSLEAENGIMVAAFDHTGTRLVTGEADKTIKIYKPSASASEMSHPVDMAAWRKQYITESKQRY
jgi:pleiotropic regulator 1